MRFGLHLTTAVPMGQAIDLVRRAEELGIEEISYHDAVTARPVWPVLAAFAAVTSRVTLGSSVSNPFVQHPSILAENVAHLDEISGGRAFAGLGQGSHYDLVGLAPKDRLRALEEAVGVVRHLLEGEEGPVAGQHFSLAEGTALAFGDRRRVPVHLGVFGPKATRLAGRIADRIRPAGQWDPAFARQLRAWLDEGAAEVGRDPSEVGIVLQNWCFLGDDVEWLRAQSRRLLAVRLPNLGPMVGFYGVTPDELAAAEAVRAGDTSALGAIRDETIEHFMAVGDAEVLRAGLDRIADAGFDAVTFSGSLGPDPEVALEIIGAEIARRRTENDA